MMRLCRRRPPPSPNDAVPKKRIMHSTGHNIVTVGVPDKHWKYISDLYTTLIDIKWRWNILIFVGGFVFTWIAFACFYYLQGYLHGDFDSPQRSDTPCMEKVRTFTGAYLFSIETMSTIGYGSRMQTEECPGVWLAVMLQSIIGAGLQFALASVVVSKTRRAKRRSETILFSSQICICEQDSRLQLSVRVGDMRKSEIMGAHATGFLIKKLRSSNGTLVPVRSFTLDFKAESGRDEIFFPWPTLLLHVIDETSPLWSLSRDDFLNDEYELIVVIDGVCGTNSSSFQARKSYHTWEMKWGYRFTTLNLNYNQGSFVMDLANFHHTVPASTPLCSAQDITHLRELHQTSQTKQQQEVSLDSSPNRRRRSQEKVTSAQNGKERNHSARSKPETSGPVNVPHAIDTRRSISWEENRTSASPTDKKPSRRCSLGDLIRAHSKESNSNPKPRDSNQKSRDDALNIYRHRLSVTDTYLGAGIEEQMENDEGNNEAILSIVSQRSIERRTDMREVFKRRRSSVSMLFFGPEISPSDEEDTQEEVLEDTSPC